MKWENKGHEFDEIGYLLKDKKNLYIYGAGISSGELIWLIKKVNRWANWNIYLIDKDEVKQREGRYGLDVLSPEQFFSMEKENYFVIAGAYGDIADEIYEILKTNLPEDAIIFKSFYFIYTYLTIYFAYVHDMVFFTSENMLPSTVCNLNCRDCLNFTPYIKKHSIESLDELKRTVDLFFGAVDLIYRFQITGGEPLLYKNLLPLLQYIDEKYRDKILRFEMVTNGTIVPSDELCEFMKEKEMYIFLDDYRMSLPDGEERYQKVKEQLIKHEVDFADNHVDRWIRMYIPEEDKHKDIPSEEALCNKFHVCNNPWSSLWHGMISSCNYTMYAAKADLCELKEEEYFYLEEFTPEKKKELIEFRLRFNKKGYTEFCRKCGGWTDTNVRWCQPAIQEERGIHNEME